MTFQEQQIQEAYKNHQKEIQNKIDRLQAWLNNHNREENKDWEHCGDLNHVSYELEKLIDFMKS